MKQIHPIITTRSVKNSFHNLQLTIAYFLSSLVIIVFISSCCSKQECKSTALWDGKYVEGIVINQATKYRGIIGVFLVNLDEDDPEEDRYLCLFRYKQDKEIHLGDKFYITASEINGIPMVEDIKDQVSDEELFSGPVKTNINEHTRHSHGLTQGVHKKAHYSPGPSSQSYILNLGNDKYTIGRSDPLFNKLYRIYESIHGNSISDSVEVYYKIQNESLLNIDTCHYHNGISMGCL